LTLSSVLLVAIAALRYRKIAGEKTPPQHSGPALRSAAVAAVAGTGALLVLAAAAGPAIEFTGAAARQLFDRNAYATALAAARSPAPDGSSR
jgi:hypothetical protein